MFSLKYDLKWALLRNHLRASSPEVAIRNNFVEINLATIVASFNRIRKIQTQQ